MSADPIDPAALVPPELRDALAAETDRLRAFADAHATDAARFRKVVAAYCRAADAAPTDEDADIVLDLSGFLELYTAARSIADMFDPDEALRTRA